MKRARPVPTHRTPLAPLALLAAACGGGGNGGGSTAPADTGDPVTTYISFRRTNAATLPPFSDLPELGGILRGDKDFAPELDIVNSVVDGFMGGVALDYFGNLYVANVDFEPFQQNLRGISIHWTPRLREGEFGVSTYDGAFDRRIFGFSTGFDAPRSVALAHGAGLLFVTDSGAANIKVFGSAASGNVAPLRVVETTPGAAPGSAPWDLVYDEPRDRLFVALLDGSIAVYDAFVAAAPTVPDRFIEPSSDGAAQTTTSLRGIDLDPDSAGERLVFTDVGVEDGGVDGLVGAVEGASTASGVTAATFVPASVTGLQDPVDVVVTADGRLRVADLQADRVVILAAGLLAPGAGAPSRAVELTRAVDRPTAIVLEPADPVRSVGAVGDLEDPAQPLAGLVVTVDPGANSGALLLIDESLVGPVERTLGLAAAARGVGVDSVGDVYVCSQGTVAGTVRVVNRFVTERGTGADVTINASRDRLLQAFPGTFGQNPSFRQPVALDVDEVRDVVIVSDPVFPRVWVLGRTAGERGEAAFFVDDGFVSTVAVPGGLDYEPSTDRLYVAVSNGTIHVYDTFLASPGTLPDHVITPAGPTGTTQISTSIAEVLYDAATDTLFATETGAASGAGADGAIYVFEDVSTAGGGLVTPTRILAGPSTGLDDPTDLAWNGETLWVVDTATDTISTFAAALTLDGDVAPTATRVEPDVRAVALAPEGLAPRVGGSILGQ